MSLNRAILLCGIILILFALSVGIIRATDWNSFATHHNLPHKTCHYNVIDCPESKWCVMNYISNHITEERCNEIGGDWGWERPLIGEMWLVTELKKDAQKQQECPRLIELSPNANLSDYPTKCRRIWLSEMPLIMEELYRR
jgi:hypothetical protein